MLKVSVNNKLIEVAPDTTLADALPQWDAAGEPATGGAARRFVIAINKEFVPRTEYACVILKEGDEIDLVRPVWGG